MEIVIIHDALTESQIDMLVSKSHDSVGIKCGVGHWSIDILVFIDDQSHGLLYQGEQSIGELMLIANIKYIFI